MQRAREHLRHTAAHGEHGHIAALHVPRGKGRGNSDDLEFGQLFVQLCHQLGQVLRVLKHALALAQAPSALLNDKQPPDACEHTPVKRYGGN